MDIFIAVLLFIAVILQGGFFPTTYIILGIVAAIVLPFVTKKIPPIKITLTFLVICVLYVISAIINNPSFDGFISAARPLVCFLFFILAYNVKDKNNASKYIVIIGLVTGGIGLLAYCNIIVLSGANTVGRLQSTFQYANAAGIFLAVCGLLTNDIESKKLKNKITIIETSLLLTQSVGSIISYILGLVICITMSDKKDRRSLLLRFCLNLIFSAVFAALIYISSVILKQSIVSAVMLVLFLASCRYIQTIIDKLINNKFGLIISIVGVAASGSLIFFVRSNSAWKTYIERIIQINDGFNVMLSHLFMGVGPGIWENIKFTWQSASYEAGYIHSSIIQLGVDAGVLAIAAVIVLIIIWFKNINMRRRYIFSSIVIILLHSLLDITLNFISICFLLIILSCLIIESPMHVIKSRVPVILSSIAVTIMLIYLFSGQIELNNGLKFFTAGDAKSAIEVLEQSEYYYKNSYSANFLLSRLYYQTNQYDKFYEQIERLPYKTSDVYYLESNVYSKQNKPYDAINSTFRCIELSRQQKYGYELAEQIIGVLPDAEKNEYNQKLDKYKAYAKSVENKLSYIIKK